MRYTVAWNPAAEQELASIWNDATDRDAVTAAADSLDADFERDPLSLGEARGGATRVVFRRPLAVLFDVDTARRHVEVWDVWRWPA
jgi:hypothetical protein